MMMPDGPLHCIRCGQDFNAPDAVPVREGVWLRWLARCDYCANDGPHETAAAHAAGLVDE
jgi:hypothetical protein